MVRSTVLRWMPVMTIALDSGAQLLADLGAARGLRGMQPTWPSLSWLGKPWMADTTRGGVGDCSWWWYLPAGGSTIGSTRYLYVAG
jgi:hypothetical protein